jgi:D-2-hydroxyacid dehydrogenase (NADP+)
VRTPEALATHLPQADVLVVSMLWKDTLVTEAKKLKSIQSISAGVDQYDKDTNLERLWRGEATLVNQVV